MKKKLFNAVSTLAIAAIVALNVHVVTSEQTPAFLKWDVIGKILASGSSGSGGSGPASGSASGGECQEGYYCGYYNETKVIYGFWGDVSAYLTGSYKIPVGLNIRNGANGSLNYCVSSMVWWKKCYKSMMGWTPFS